MLSKSIVFALIFFVASTAARAEDKKAAKAVHYVDPANAGPDFAIQGEYVGTYASRDGTQQNLAAQVVAIGDGNFLAYFLPGGLPHEGWDGKTRLESKGKTEQGKTSFQGAVAASTEKGDVLSGELASGEKFELKKIFRASPTLGLKWDPLESTCRHASLSIL